MDNTAQGYAERVSQQVNQFARPELLKKLPPIYHYWMDSYIRPRFRAVTDAGSVLDFYVKNLSQAISGQDHAQVVSLGAGDGNIEQLIAERLLARGASNFVIVCLELSEPRIRRAEHRVKGLPVEKHLLFRVADLNTWGPTSPLDGVIAHHSLHHIVELEHLFRDVAASLKPNGVFVSADMIGRNGHMRWPEAEAIIFRLWKLLPDRYKTQHQLGKFHEEFVNWDCSRSGFEGIRAQDVLPLLRTYFDFSTFFAYGSLPDIFVERGYGHNLDPGNPFDTAFIEFLEYLNETLIDSRVITPTMMIAAMHARRNQVQTPRCYKNWTPEHCTRDSTIPALVGNPASPR